MDLRKLPVDDDNTDLWGWMKFIKSNSSNEEELEMLATRSPQMQKAISILRRLSLSKRARDYQERQDMLWRDIQSIKDTAVEEAVAKAVAEKDAEIARLKAQ